MNTIIASFRIIEGKEAEAEEAMQKQAAAVEANEPGALAYVFHRHAKDPARSPSSRSTRTTSRHRPQRH